MLELSNCSDKFVIELQHTQKSKEALERLVKGLREELQRLQQSESSISDLKAKQKDMDGMRLKIERM